MQRFANDRRSAQIIKAGSRLFDICAGFTGPDYDLKFDGKFHIFEIHRVPKHRNVMNMNIGDTLLFDDCQYGKVEFKWLGVQGHMING